MRHLAWLGAVPQRKSGKRAGGAEPDPALSRLEQLKADGGEPSYPPCSAVFLVGYLMQIGPTEAAGADAGPISWREINEWEAGMGVTLMPWQKLLLRRLSTEYLVQSRRARDEDCPAPWAEVTAVQRASVETKMRSLFASLMGRVTGRA